MRSRNDTTTIRHLSVTTRLGCTALLAQWGHVHLGFGMSYRVLRAISALQRMPTAFSACNAAEPPEGTLERLRFRYYCDRIIAF